MNTTKLESSLSATLFRVGLLAFLTLLTFGQLQRIQLSNSIAFYIHEIVLLVWFLLLVTRHLKKFLLFFRKILTLPVLLLPCLYVLIQQLIFSLLDFQLHPLLYLLRITLYSTLIWIVRLGIEKKFISKQYCTTLLLTTSLSIAALGLIQYAVIPDVRFLQHLGWDDHYYRLISTLFDPGYTALIITLGFVLLWRSTVTKSTLLLIGYTTLSLIALLLTYSRAGYLAFLASSLYLFFSAQKRHLIIIIIIFFAAIPFLPRPAGEGVKLERTASITSRTSSISKELSTLSTTQLLFGRGFYRNIRTDTLLPNHATAPDNSFVFIFSSLGLIGSTTLIMAIRKWLSIFKITSELTPIMIAIAVHSLFNNSLFYIWSMSFIFMLLGMTQRREAVITDDR